MNFQIISYILGWVIFLEGSFMILPLITAIIYKERTGVIFAACSIICILFGYSLMRQKPKNSFFFAREGFVTVALCWIALSVIGAFPFYISGEIPSFVDAVFETVSGFTTTGASILTNVEAMSHCLKLWRSFTHWIGGMGVLVFILTVLPLAGGQTIHLMRAESPGPSIGKFVPKMRKTAFILYAIYFVLTIIEFIFLMAGKMPVFDAICITFGTAGTGGFGILNDSIGSYSGYIQMTVAVFMLLFGVNFNFYYIAIFGKIRDALKNEEVLLYIYIMTLATILITINLGLTGGSVSYHFKHAFFQVSSLMTSTGFSTVDFNLWPPFSRTILITVAMIGACAGSTGGGIKVSRIIITAKTIGKEFAYLIHPRSVKVLKMDGKIIPNEEIRSVHIFLVTYFLIFVVSVLIVSFDEFDLVTNFTAVVATINNTGPGLELVGPAGNFSMFSPLSKVVLMFNMLAGRLEIFPLLLLFMPGAWKKNR
ncbi:MAG: TrkH family potassium uptake protein [Firmicutes bacterium]|nr:TrkH family potassium uptake protein [Bacillota bacterium]